MYQVFFFATGGRKGETRTCTQCPARGRRTTRELSTNSRGGSATGRGGVSREKEKECELIRSHSQLISASHALSLIRYGSFSPHSTSVGRDSTGMGAAHPESLRKVAR